MICTSLNKIRKRAPCKKGWKKLLAHLGKTKADDEPLPFSVIVESNGFDDALWACRTTPEYDHEWRLFAVWCARQVQHLMTHHHSVDALDVAERFAKEQATNEELHVACMAASKVAAAAVEDATWAAEYAARAAAGVAASKAAWAAASKAAWAAAGVAESAAEIAVWDATRDAARDAARAAARDAQKQKFLDVVSSARGEHV